MKIKLHYSVYRDALLGDSTNRGLSSRINGGYVIQLRERSYPCEAAGYPDCEETKIRLVEYLRENGNPEEMFIVIEDICCGLQRLRAIPVQLYLSGEWTMFGGNFLYSCDSRAFANPVKIFDRVE